jgi:biotin carboxylase
MSTASHRILIASSAITQVLKPTDSAGSDGVKLCNSMEEAKEHFHHLLTVEAVNGGYNTQVLCQEFLRGKEYVVDHVSRDGVHKTMAVWVYDKRPRNGSQFVYFGMCPIDPESNEAKILIPYSRGVLDALGMLHGVGKKRLREVYILSSIRVWFSSSRNPRPALLIRL